MVGIVLQTPGYVMANGGPTTAPFTLTPGSTATVNFNLWEQVSVAGVVFNDLNGNGVQDPGEPGIPGSSSRILLATRQQR